MARRRRYSRRARPRRVFSARRGRAGRRRSPRRRIGIRM